MDSNMGPEDKKIRMTVGILLLVVGLLFQSWWGLLGLVLLITSVVGFCPLYVPFKVSTLKAEPQEAGKKAAKAPARKARPAPRRRK